ncbi:MAG: Nif3-like dinuclear metal center hexameric protein, partial [Saprospiraceae bacterium]
MNKNYIFLSFLFFLFNNFNSSSVTPTPPLPAATVIARIQEHVTCDWQAETVDTYKGGSPEMQVTGIATTFLATMEVLKQAKAKGLNLIITHEPTFYTHLDKTDHYGENAIVAAKQKFIKDNGLIVWRFHDHWHRTEPDGIYKGVVNKLGWQQYELNK